MSAPLAAVQDYIPGWPSPETRAHAAAEEWRKQDLAGIVELPWLASMYACSALRWGAKPEQVVDALTKAYATGRAA